jgi:arsenate reductase-like glutaredoxin family protein
MAPAELKRFAQRLGAPAIADTDGRAWSDGGLGYLRMSDDELFERLLANQLLLRLPLARYGVQVTVGIDEAAWKLWKPPGQDSVGTRL